MTVYQTRMLLCDEKDLGGGGSTSKMSPMEYKLFKANYRPRKMLKGRLNG